jgi:hypothetical protein
VTLGLGLLDLTQLRDRGPDLAQLALKPLRLVVLATLRPRALELGRKGGADLVDEPVGLLAVDPRLAGEGDRLRLAYQLVEPSDQIEGVDPWGFVSR